MKIYRAGPQLVFTFDNRFSSTGWAVSESVRYIFFRLQPSCLSATSHTGRKSCRAKSLYETFLDENYVLKSTDPVLYHSTKVTLHESTNYKILSPDLTFPVWRNVKYIMGEGQNVPAVSYPGRQFSRGELHFDVKKQ
jgi:hypothetical protein